jgi:malate synthase
MEGVHMMEDLATGKVSEREFADWLSRGMNEIE